MNFRLLLTSAFFLATVSGQTTSAPSAAPSSAPSAFPSDAPSSITAGKAPKNGANVKGSVKSGGIKPGGIGNKPGDLGIKPGGRGIKPGGGGGIVSKETPAGGDKGATKKVPKNRQLRRSP